MKYTIKMLMASVALMFSTMSNSASIPIDLTTWVAEGDGVWTLGPSNESVIQSINGDQTVFFDPSMSSLGSIFSGSISVGNERYDDDFIGFVLGYQSGELTSSSAEYYVIDWKRVTQTYEGDVANKGLAFSTVNGSTSFADLWSHTGSVSEIERGSTLGSTGWKPNIQYEFDIVYTSSLIEVFVNNVLQMSVTAAEAGLANFADGAIGFYNLSQSEVTYSGLTSEETEDNPVQVTAPTSIAFFGLSLIVLALRKRFNAKI